VKRTLKTIQGASLSSQIHIFRETGIIKPNLCKIIFGYSNKVWVLGIRDFRMNLGISYCFTVIFFFFFFNKLGIGLTGFSF
jgi:hypothetical protein